MGKLSGKLSKNFSKTFPALKRFSGRGSYESSFKMVLTKLIRGSNKKFHYKTIRNGVVSGLSGGILENISGGFFDGIKEWYDEWNALPQN